MILANAGNNVTIANKFESGSEPERINVSPTTYKWVNISHIISTPGNIFLGYVPYFSYYLPFIQRWLLAVIKNIMPEIAHIVTVNSRTSHTLTVTRLSFYSGATLLTRTFELCRMTQKQ